MNNKNCPFDITPYEKSSLVKLPKLNNLNYTNQDFWSMKSRLIDFIKEKFKDNFNNFVESDISIMLIENWAFIADTLSFKIDQIANEIFIDTVSEVGNAFRLSSLVGFKPQPPICSRSMWSATISTTLDTNLVMNTPINIVVNTEDGPKTIELFAADSQNQPIFNEDILIPSGTFLNTSIIGLEGKTRSSVFAATGDPNQSYFIPGPIITNSVDVIVNGNKWNRVNYFTDSQPRPEFRLEYDEDYNAFVIFGNNSSGQIPTTGASVFIQFRVGGGVAGNIVTGAVETQLNFIVPGFEFRIPVTFINYTRGEFGYSGDNIEDIRRKLPFYLRIQDRTVSGDDIEIYCNQFVTEFNGRIGKSKAILRNHGCAANIIDLYILSIDSIDGLKESDDGLKVQLRQMLQEKKMLTDFICIKDGTIILTDVSVDLTVDKFYRKFEEEIKNKVNRRINGFFNLNNWDYEKTLKSIDLIKSISDINEISNTEVNFQTSSDSNSGEVVVTKFYEIIRPNIIDINFIYE